MRVWRPCERIYTPVTAFWEAPSVLKAVRQLLRSKLSPFAMVAAWEDMIQFPVTPLMDALHAKGVRASCFGQTYSRCPGEAVSWPPASFATVVTVLGEDTEDVLLREIEALRPGARVTLSYVSRLPVPKARSWLIKYLGWTWYAVLEGEPQLERCQTALYEEAALDSQPFIRIDSGRFLVGSPNKYDGYMLRLKEGFRISEAAP